LSLSHEEVLEILRLLDASGFDELRLETDGYKLHLRRSGAPARSPDEPAPAPAQAAAPVATGATAPLAPSNPDGLIDVPAPMLGTFYRAPKPGAPPFVEVGSIVDEQTVVGIVEVMKLMNAICAGVRGAVEQIVAREGTLVEYGDVLIRVRPEGA
jgi:acetyl-CoA carboxylase biotin carboxyl carrier protein